MAIDLDPQLHHARGCAPVDHHIVHGQGREHTFPTTHHLRLHEAAVIDFVLTGQHGAQGFGIPVQRNIGDKAQAPLVDADERHLKRRQPTAHAQHGAIPAHHQAQIALVANVFELHRRVARQAQFGGGIDLQHHLAALVHQEMGDAVQRGARGGHRGRGVAGQVFAGDGNLAELRVQAGVHRQITSLKCFDAR